MFSNACGNCLIRWDSNLSCFIRDLFAKRYIGRQEGNFCQRIDAQSAGLFKIAAEHKFEVA
eukprot:scaffold412429_cov40-Prasinocladus_malaysianus.AAC.1